MDLCPRPKSELDCFRNIFLGASRCEPVALLIHYGPADKASNLLVRSLGCTGSCCSM